MKKTTKTKVLLVDQLGSKTYEYDYAAAKYYSDDFDVTCYVSDDTPKDIDTSGFKVKYGFHNVYSGNKVEKGLKYIKSLIELTNYVREEKFDIINLQWYDLPLIDKLFIKSIKKLYKPSIKVVLTVHGIIPKNKNALKHYGLKEVYKEADAILLHSEPGLKLFNECFYVDCPKYMITSAFRDEEDYIPKNKIEARKKLGIPIDKIVLLSFGTIRADKSIDLLYRAFPKALEYDNRLYLLSAGTLNVKNKNYYKKLANNCIKTGSATITFDYVPKELEPFYYSAADILILPYSYISQSGVAYCGLLFNLPMIVSNIPRLDLMAKKKVNAEVFDSGNVNSLVQAIITLSSDSKRMDDYKEGSKMIREKDFSIKKRVELTEKAYRDLLKND